MLVPSRGTRQEVEGGGEDGAVSLQRQHGLALGLSSRGVVALQGGERDELFSSALT